MFEEEREEGEGMLAGAWVMQKVSCKISIFWGVACEEKKKKKQHKKWCLCFSWGCSYYSQFNISAPFGQDSSHLGTRTEWDQDSTRRSSAGTVPSHAARLLLSARGHGFFSSYITPGLVRQTLQPAGYIMCCSCFDFEALGPSCQLACTIMGQTANSKRMQEIKEMYVFLRIWMTGEESLIWLWTLVIYLEPWSKTAVSLKSIKILSLTSLETLFSFLCQRKVIVENIHRQHFHICVSREEMTLCFHNAYAQTYIFLKMLSWTLKTLSFFFFSQLPGQVLGQVIGVTTGEEEGNMYYPLQSKQVFLFFFFLSVELMWWACFVWFCFWYELCPPFPVKNKTKCIC